MADLSAPNGDGLGERQDIAAVAAAVTQHNRLATQIVKDIVPLLAKENVPAQVKLYVGLTVLLIVSISAGLVILLANLLALLIGIKDFHFEYYLAYVGLTLAALLLVLITASGPARRFENTANLEVNLQSVTNARAARKRAAGSPRRRPG